MNHAEVRELLAAYAIDAIDPDERAALERHLDECRECRLEVGAHLETAGLLAAEPAQPPEHVWQGIRAAVAGSDEAPVVSPLRGKQRSPWLARGAAVLAAAAAVVFAVVAVGALSEQNRLEDRVDELAASLERSGIEQAARSALLDPSARRVTLRSPDEAQVVQLVYLPSGTGYLLDHNLDSIAEDRAYQLWVLHGERAVSAGVLGRQPDITAFTAAGPVDGFAVSVEDSQGAIQPTTDPVALGFLD